MKPINENDEILLINLTKYYWISFKEIVRFFYDAKLNENAVKNRLYNLRKMEFIDFAKLDSYRPHVRITELGRKYVKGYSDLLEEKSNRYFGLSPKFESKLIYRMKANTNSNELKIQKTIDFSLFLKREGIYNSVECPELIKINKSIFGEIYFPDVSAIKIKSEQKTTINFDIEVKSHLTFREVLKNLLKMFKQNIVDGDYSKNIFLILGNFGSVQSYIRNIRQMFEVCFEMNMNSLKKTELFKAEFDLKNYQNQYEFNAIEFKTWLRSRKIFFGVCSDYESFKDAQFSTFDHKSFYGSLEIPKKYESVGGAVSMSALKLLE